MNEIIECIEIFTKYKDVPDSLDVRAIRVFEEDKKDLVQLSGPSYPELRRMIQFRYPIVNNDSF